MTVVEERSPGELRLTAKLSCPVKEARSLGMCCASWVRDAVGEGASILWPNHVVKDGRRLCAVECRVTGNNEIMLTFRPDMEQPGMSEEALFDRIVSSAETALAGFPDNGAALLQKYCEHCDTLMKFVDTTYRGMPIYGFAFAVDKNGGLMVMTQESHTVVTLYGGEAVIAAKRDPDQPDMPVMA